MDDSQLKLNQDCKTYIPNTWKIKLILSFPKVKTDLKLVFPYHTMYFSVSWRSKKNNLEDDDLSPKTGGKMWILFESLSVSLPEMEFTRRCVPIHAERLLLLDEQQIGYLESHGGSSNDNKSRANIKTTNVVSTFSSRMGKDLEVFWYSSNLLSDTKMY